MREEKIVSVMQHRLSMFQKMLGEGNPLYAPQADMDVYIACVAHLAGVSNSAIEDVVGDDTALVMYMQLKREVIIRAYLKWLIRPSLN